MRTSNQCGMRNLNIWKKEGVNWFSVSNVSGRLNNLKTENHISLATKEPLVTLTSTIFSKEIGTEAQLESSGENERKESRKRSVNNSVKEFCYNGKMGQLL